MVMLDRIEKAILAAHAAGNGQAMAELYAEAAQHMLSNGQIERGCFYLTQGYVFALEEGLASASGIHARLVELGHEI